MAAYIKNEFAGVFCLHAYASHLKLLKLAQEDDNDNIQPLLEVPAHFDILLSPIKKIAKQTAIMRDNIDLLIKYI